MSIMNSKGQVTIPKHVRDAVGLKPGNRVEFAVTQDRRIVMRTADFGLGAELDRFDQATGCADIKWRADELMKLLRN